MKYMALTFDDGPNTDATIKILDLLEKYNAKGSFFVNGSKINETTIPVMKRAVSQGCEIHNHSVNHYAMPELSDEDILWETKENDRRIEDAIGIKPSFFRPPYIAVDDRMHKLIDLPFICGVGCDDWDYNVPVQTRIDEVCKNAADGEIILLHDIEDNYNTVEALDVIIPRLQNEGYEFVTISQLFKLAGCEPKAHNGVIYSFARDNG